MARDDSFDIFSPDPFGRDIIYGLSTGQERLGLQPPPQGLPVDTRPYDRMQATPRGFISGLFSDVLGGTFNMPQMPRTGIPAVDVFSPNMNLFNRLAFGDVQKTAERISYGEPLTTGQGMTLKPREETIGAALTVAPFAGEAARLGVRAGRAGARMVGQEIADRVSTGQAILPSSFAEPRSSLFAVEPNPMMPKPQAPVSELGFYSAAEQAALNLPRNKGTGQSFLNDLMKAPDVKKDELAWTGLDDFLKDKPNVTKQEVQDFIANNKVDLQEVRLGESPIEDPIGIAQRKAVFDKYEPEIQQLYSELDNVTAQKRNALKLANAKYDEMLYQLNKDGYMPTAQDYEAFNLAEKEVRQANRMQNDDIDIRNRLGKIQNMRDAEADAFYKIPEPAPTKHPRWQLAGGENYREILLKLPNKAMEESVAAEMHYRNFIQKGGEPNWAELPAETQQSIINSIPSVYKNLSASPEYRSSHFDEPNILAHIRVNDRVDADGKKMLLVEEIQSDWHQAGREVGYKTGKERTPAQVEKELTITTQKRSRLIDEAAALPDSEMTKFKAMNEEIKALGEQATKLNEEWTNLLNKPEGVPDAPFKDTWYQLALKRVMKYAADNGYDRVGLTTGKQQIDRFSNAMRQNVDEITFQTGQKLTSSEADELQALRSQQTYMTGTERARYEYLSSNEGEYVGKGETKIKAFKGSKPTFTGTVKDGKFIDGPAEGKTVEEVLGKTMAKQIAEKQTGVLKGDNLTVGGEGMKAYYDEIYPKFLEKYGKKWDASVGETTIATDRTRDAQGIPSMYPTKEPIRYIDITPKMKESVGKGQPLFTAIPAGTLGLGGLEYADPFANPLAEDTTR
jgi:hypothetical protein